MWTPILLVSALSRCPKEIINTIESNFCFSIIDCSLFERVPLGGAGKGSGFNGHFSISNHQDERFNESSNSLTERQGYTKGRTKNTKESDFLSYEAKISDEEKTEEVELLRLELNTLRNADKNADAFKSELIEFENQLTIQQETILQS